MAAWFSTATSKLARLDGQIHAAQNTIAALESLIGGDHDEAITASISRLTDLADSLSDSRNFYAAKSSLGGNIGADTLIHNYMRGFSEQAVVFDGIPVQCRDKDKANTAIRLNTMLAQPDNVPPMDTLAGPMAVGMETCQGLVYAGSVLAEAIRAAGEATNAQHSAEPFTSWDDMRDYFNLYFGNNYVPFISSE